MSRLIPAVIRTLAWLLGASVLACAGCQPVVWDEYVGQSRERVLQSLGPPTEEWNYRHGLGRLPEGTAPDKSHTLVYKRRGGGTLYIIFKPDHGGWRCYESGWVRDGVIID